MKKSPESEIARRLRTRIARHRERRIGIVKRKVLLLLLSGISLGLTGSPGTYWKIIGALRKDWSALTKQAAERAINGLYASKLIAVNESVDGTLTLVLSEKGKKKALSYNLVHMKIRKPAVWDGLWRLISFDVPIVERETRDAIRGHLLRLGFYEIQQSLFIHPYSCEEEIEYLVELYDARKYVRRFLVSRVDNSAQLKQFFYLH